jgi:hypothetical protein
MKRQPEAALIIETKLHHNYSIILWRYQMFFKRTIMLLKILLGVIVVSVQNSPELIVSNIEKWLKLLGFPDFMHTNLFVQISTWSLRVLVCYCLISLTLEFYKSKKNKKLAQQKLNIFQAIDLFKENNVKIDREDILAGVFSNRERVSMIVTRRNGYFIF